MLRIIKSITVYSLLIILSTAAALLIAEAGVRLFLPQQLIQLNQDVYTPTDQLGFKLKPNNDITVNRGDGDVRLITDDQGYRIGTNSQAPADTRILALGDSFLEALQVEYEQTMTSLMEEKLTQDIGKKVSIINTGVSMYNPNHYLMVARKELARRDFSLVIVFIYMANDVVDEHVPWYPPLAPTTRHTFRIPQSFSKREIIDSVLYPINDFLEQRSHLFVMFKDRGRTLLARLGLSPYYFPRVMKSSMAKSPDWALTVEILKSIEQEARMHETPVVFVLLPASYQVDKKAFDWYVNSFEIDPEKVDIDQPSRILATSLKRSSLAVFDTMPSLRKAQDEGNLPLYGKVDPHFSPDGHRVVAQYLAPLVRPYLEPGGQAHQVTLTGSESSETRPNATEESGVLQ